MTKRYWQIKIPGSDGEASVDHEKWYALRDADRTSSLPSVDKEFITVPEAAAILNISPYQMRSAIYKGHIRSKRSSKASRARFLIHREWLEEYERYLESPTLRMRIKAWFRKHF
jgi:hypothetical protein